MREPRKSSPPDTGELSPHAIVRRSAELGVPLGGEQGAQLAAFAGLLLKWNRVHNLTAIDSPGDVLSHHLLDSLSIVPSVISAASGSPKQLRALDVGSGGGLPAVPIAIALPNVHVTAIDRVQKKTAFLQQARIELRLDNFDVVHDRVERFKAPRFDVIVSRAFAELAEMVRRTRHLLAPDGEWIAMKGIYPASEIDALPPEVRLMRTVKLHVPLLGAERHLVVLGLR